MTQPSDLPRPFPLTASRSALLKNGEDHELRQLLYEVTALSARIEAMRAQFSKRLGISSPQYSILLYVAQNQGQDGLTLTAIAEALHVSGPHVTKESKALVEMGLLQKRPNPADGRSSLLQSTKKSDHAIAELAPILRAVNDSLFQSLSTERFTELVSSVHDTLLDADRTLARLPYFLDQ